MRTGWLDFISSLTVTHHLLCHNGVHKVKKITMFLYCKKVTSKNIKRSWFKEFNRLWAYGSFGSNDKRKVINCGDKSIAIITSIIIITAVNLFFVTTFFIPTGNKIVTHHSTVSSITTQYYKNCDSITIDMPKRQPVSFWS